MTVSLRSSMFILRWYIAATFSPNRVTTQQFKTVVLWLGLGKRWPLCTTVLFH